MTSSFYHEKRKAFYRGISGFWPDLYGEEYALFDIAVLEGAEFQAIRDASGKIGHILFKTNELLRNLDEGSLAEMGYPAETIPYLGQKPALFETTIARLDLALTPSGIKVLEINSDTPTFIKECFSVNGRLCAEFGMENPNYSLEGVLADAVRKSVHAAAASVSVSHPYIIFTAHGENIEDRETSIYLKEISGVPSKFVPLDQLSIEQGEGLFDSHGIKIDVLYRQTYPIENMVKDQDEQGNPIGIWLLELVAEGKLAIVNPVSAFLLQNKAVLAIIWNLHMEGNPFYTEQEHGWIDEFFLPSYLEPDPFLEQGKKFVKKPVFGREGDTVEIFSAGGSLELADEQTSYSEYVSLYQEFAELPKMRFQSEKGEQDGHILTGCFLIGGKPAAIGFRAGGPITNNLSYFLPVAEGKGKGSPAPMAR
ncbi:glutathionylspermidine synthase [Bacillus sp. FJAT-27225]|uniref:glutathionylspermidine synthase family protein n=1 Tax=Bacillus sp. FJAT-27225 TaxID=1743144 RepID=UPI00080C2FEE|nr:glutathionylspermidine synthase family protein [Bacillus sp. FJAT-27225]OCA90600.1 glutathionylspermidine synthase [Bacillus sp. FJAT-27225]